MSFVGSLLAGLAAAVLFDNLRPAFDEVKSLEQLSGRPVLGTVSMLVTPQGARQRQAGLRRFGAAFVVLIVMQAIWVAWIAMRQQLL
jgi:hypothetical protein